MSASVDQELARRLEKLSNLSWISDAPLFIDDAMVEQFFDAIVRPTYEHESVTESEEESKTKDLRAAIELAGKLKLDKPDWIPDWLFPLKGEISATGEGEGNINKSKTNSVTKQLKPIWNAERQLEDLTRHYFRFHPKRLVVGRKPIEEDEAFPSLDIFNGAPDFFLKVPRALAFIDLPPKTIVIPTAAEFEDGTISLLYEELARRLTTEDGGPKRKYPDEFETDEEKLKKQRQDYWASYVVRGCSTAAMIVIEEASQRHRRIRWIDFRVLIDGVEPLHLHAMPKGNADAGVFGYNFVRRAYNHGIRLVGTLKSGPDMNVLAIYEK